MYLHVPALPLGLNLSAGANNTFPTFTLADLQDCNALCVTLAGTHGYAMLYVCRGWLVVVNNTGGAGGGGLASVITLCPMRTGWSHLRVRLRGDGNFSVVLDGLPIATCVLMEYSVSLDDMWTTLNVTLPGVEGQVKYHLDAIGSTGIEGYEVGGNWNMTNVNGTGLFSFLAPGHWREYFITVPRSYLSQPGTRDPLVRFTNPVSGLEIGRWGPSTSVQMFYDSQLTNMSSLSRCVYGGAEFEDGLNLVNLGNVKRH